MGSLAPDGCVAGPIFKEESFVCGEGSTAATAEPDWAPFAIARPGDAHKKSRAMLSPEGIGDRLRSAAFAEIQAKFAFKWAAQHFEDAPEPLKRCWLALSREEDKHLNMLLQRMAELNVSVVERTQTANLWRSLTACK